MSADDEVLEAYTARVERYVRQEVSRMARRRVDDLPVSYDHRHEAFVVRVPTAVELVDDPHELSSADPARALEPVRTRVVAAQTFYVTAEVVRRAVPPPDYWRDALLWLITALADAKRRRPR